MKPHISRPGPRGRSLALVESPVQLLNVIEWAHTGRSPAPVEVAALPAADPISRRQLRLMTDIAREQGLGVRWYEARVSRLALARTVAAVAPRVATAPRLVLGDPFSRLAQTLLPLARTRELVVVDDGTATMEFVSLLAEGRPLVRWHRSGRAGRRPGRAFGAAAAARRLTPGAGRAVEVFSALPLGPPPPGLEVTANRFAWTRGAYGPPQLIDGCDLVGTSLVETGVVDLDRYLAAVAELARVHGATRYLAHRREHPEKLRRLTETTGLSIERPELPLELAARRGPIARKIISFPSTVVHTLPVALADTGVSVAVCEVDQSWLTSAAPDRAGAFLTSVTSTARHHHHLASVPAVQA